MTAGLGVGEDGGEYWPGRVGEDPFGLVGDCCLYVAGQDKTLVLPGRPGCEFGQCRGESTVGGRLEVLDSVAGGVGLVSVALRLMPAPGDDGGPDQGCDRSGQRIAFGPAGQTVIAQVAGRGLMGRVMSTAGMALVLGPAAGPVIGGLLIAHASWQWLFLVNIPVGLAGLWLGRRLVPRAEPSGAARFDVPGFVLEACLLLLGIGNALSVVPSSTTAYVTVDPPHLPDAVTLINISLRLGGAALLVSVLSSGSGGASAAESHRTAFWCLVLLSLLAVASATCVVLASRAREGRR